MRMSVLPRHTYVYHEFQCLWRTSDPLAPELQTLVSHQMGAGNKTQVLQKRGAAFFF